MTNGGGIHHTARKKTKQQRKNSKRSPKQHKPTKAMFSKAVNGTAQ